MQRRCVKCLCYLVLLEFELVALLSLVVLLGHTDISRDVLNDHSVLMFACVVLVDPPFAEVGALERVLPLVDVLGSVAPEALTVTRNREAVLALLALVVAVELEDGVLLGVLGIALGLLVPHLFAIVATALVALVAQLGVVTDGLAALHTRERLVRPDLRYLDLSTRLAVVVRFARDFVRAPVIPLLAGVHLQVVLLAVVCAEPTGALPHGQISLLRCACCDRGPQEEDCDGRELRCHILISWDFWSGNGFISVYICRKAVYYSARNRHERNT